jgi:hypothetical protein
MTKSDRKIAISIVSRKENRDLEFWLLKSPEERMSAVEFLRSQYYCSLDCVSLPRIVPVIHVGGRRL